jgi:hypothetical protein
VIYAGRQLWIWDHQLFGRISRDGERAIESIENPGAKEHAMELPSFGVLFSGLLIGTVGLGMFIYGKRRPEPKCLLIGIAMCVFPYFVSSIWLMWVIAAACIAAAWALPSFE